MDTFHIIDDELEIRNILEAMATTLGYGVLAFDSADSYIDFMGSPGYQAPTAVLTDNMMPGTSGYELIAFIRKSMPMQKIAMISGTPDNKNSDSSELCCTLNKPFRMSELITLLDALKRCHSKMTDKQYEEDCKFGLNHCCPRSQKRQ